MTETQLDIFNQFSDRMMEELYVNKHKGDWVTFKDRNLIVDEINHHFDKLQKALLEANVELIQEYSADVANICMFMFNSTLKDN